MNINDIIKRIRRSLGLQKELPQETILGIMHVLETVPPDEEISCNDLYDRLDEVDAAWREVLSEIEAKLQA